MKGLCLIFTESNQNKTNRDTREMTSEKWWEQAIQRSGSKAYSAHDYYVAEKEAYAAYESRVREMTYSDEGVTPHQGNTEKCILTTALDFLASGNERAFHELTAEYAHKAQENPVRYSPLCYGLVAAAEYLRDKRRPPGKASGR
jgi:hypothetical protein